MSSDFQDRKDIDKLIHDLYSLNPATQEQVLNVVKFKEDSIFINETLDEILSKYYDKGFIDSLITRIIILEEEIKNLKGETDGN